jgi:hypothetical protein
MAEYIPNRMDRRLMGVNGLNFADGMDSSPRKQMFSSHIGQCLVVKGGTERFIQTGMERQYAKTTFSVKMPEDGTILKVIHRYQETMGDSIQNSEDILIYESAETQEIGLIRLPKYFSDQTYFGFEYKRCKAAMQHLTGKPLAKGTLLLDSPAVTETGDYKFGVECKVVYMSHPAVSEDGIMVSRDVLPKFAIQKFERRECEWGSRYIALNLYGDEFNYKPFPDIGQPVRADGLLMAFRKIESALAPVEWSAKDLMEVDNNHDRRVFADGAGGKIVDIKIYHDDYNNSNTPEAFERQAMRYHRSTQRFYKEVVDFVKEIGDRRPGGLNLSTSLHALCVEADAMLDNRANGSQERRVLLHRKNPLDDWRAEFVIQYEIIPDIGNKMTDCHGGKGVICHIANPEDMPVDENGVRADMVMDGNSTNSRMNLGRLEEQYINAASWKCTKTVREILGVQPNDTALEQRIEAMETTHPHLVNAAWDHLMGYIEIISPNYMHEPFMSGEYPHRRSHYLASVVMETEAIILFFPPENDREYPDIVRMLERDEKYRPHSGPVTYRGYSGRKVKTKRNFMIGSVYILLLEKIADDWTAVSSGKLQHHGVLSQITSWDKHSTPYRNQAIRGWGESEIRISVSYAGARLTADLLDRNNNPRTRRHMLDNLLQAPKPTDIYAIVDRKVVPYGGNKPLQLVKHMAECAGWKFVFQPYTPEAWRDVDVVAANHVNYTPTQSELH